MSRCLLSETFKFLFSPVKIQDFHEILSVLISYLKKFLEFYFLL